MQNMLVTGSWDKTCKYWYVHLFFIGGVVGAQVINFEVKADLPTRAL